LNWFKYRPFDAETGRGWQVDRLAHEYVHNSVYAFSENKVTGHIELDGLEAVSAIMYSDAMRLKNLTVPQKNEYYGNIAGNLLSYTDINDATVLATSITRGSNAINTDGTSASTLDVVFAAGGAAIPLVSGSLIKKIAGGVVEQIGQLANGSDRLVGAYRYLKGEVEQAHHIIQNAAVEKINNVTKLEGPSVHLEGKANVRGTEHYKATQEQIKRRVLGDGGTYGAERRVGYRSLRAAGLPIEESKNIIRKADEFFINQKGFSLTTPTKQVKVN
jgi:uncharacterized protein YjbJ (UPF0337 family)